MWPRWPLDREGIVAKREVIKEFNGDVDNAYYEVEYFDGSEWISASGGWQDGHAVKAMYSDADAAGLAAKGLNQTHGHKTRSVRVTP